MELNEQQERGVRRLNKACKDFAARLADLKKNGVKIQGAISNTNQKEKPKTNYLPLFSKLKEAFLDVRKVQPLLEPYFLSMDEKKRTEISADFEKLGRAEQRLDSTNGEGLLTLQECCDFSKETLYWIYTVALDYKSKKEFEKGITLLKCVNFLNPYIPESWTTLGLCLRKEGRLKEALEALSIATTLNPQNIQSRLASVYCYLDLKQPNEALVQMRDLKEALKRDPESELYLSHIKHLEELEQDHVV